MATRQLLPQRKPRGGRERREGQASKARRGERSEHVDSVNGIAIHLTVLFLILKK